MALVMADPELIKEFINESKELLENLDNDLISLESDVENDDLINRIFRAVHTIKGTSSFLGFEQMIMLGHATEDVLHLLRSGDRTVSPDVMDILLETTDKLKILVKQIQDDQIQDIDLSHVMMRLEEVAKGKSVVESREKDLGSDSNLLGEFGVINATDASTNQWDDPPDNNIEQSADPSTTRSQDGPAVKHSPSKTGTTFKDIGASTIRVDVNCLDDLMNLVGELVLERNRLIQINRAYGVGEDIDQFVEKVADATEKIQYVTNELQQAVLKTRMIPINRLFRKFPRMIRQIARDLNREVAFSIVGGETELDKTVLDHLHDPLVHLLRNAVGHGIEPPEVREAKGKSRKGSITLSASQEGNLIVVRVKDDGRGIDLEAVQNKALERGLITPSTLETMDAHQIMHLIFEPGFSTAGKVSNVSGRGVGMDVVRTNVRDLNGMVDVANSPEGGTEFILKLPLTLAVIQALMVGVGCDVYAIPLTSVVETLHIHSRQIKQVRQQAVIQHRDSVIPLLYLGELFNFEQTENCQKQDDAYVVLIRIAEKRFGLIVDRLLGQEEVVIKSLGEYLGNVPGIAGGTITGDGHVRLIVDCASVADRI